MWFGKQKRVILNADLTRYHEHLVPGTKGTLIPELKISVWGSSDRFGAVRFDCCGTTMDILLKSIDFEEEVKEPIKTQTITTKAGSENVKQTKQVSLKDKPIQVLRTMLIKRKNEFMLSDDDIKTLSKEDMVEILS